MNDDSQPQSLIVFLWDVLCRHIYSLLGMNKGSNTKPAGDRSGDKKNLENRVTKTTGRVLHVVMTGEIS